MKRIISFILFVFMFFSASFTEATPQSEFINKVAQTTETREDSLYATRDYMAYVTAKLLSSGEKSVVATDYKDVTEENAYSGYIQYLTDLDILNGAGDGMFLPKGYVSAQAACKMALSILGFGKFAEYYGGDYVIAASELGITTEIKDASKVTAGELMEIFYNAVTCPMPEIEYISQDGEIQAVVSNKKGYSYLSSRLGLNLLEGMLVSKTRFLIEKSDKYNMDYIAAGTEIPVSISPSLDAAHYEYVPSVILLNGDGEIVYIREQKSVTVEYRCIYAVNGDVEIGSAYSSELIENLEFVNDEEDYGVSDDFKVRYNGKITKSPCELTGKVARIVTENGEIIFAESFGFERAGLITSINSEEIRYEKNNSSYALYELYNYEEVIVYIDGRSGVLGDLKAGSVFDYYKDDKTLCISASEKVITDRLNSASNGKITLGNISYNTDAACVYYTGEKWENDYSDLLGSIVCCSFAPNGRIAYVQMDKGEISSYSEFYAFIGGINHIPLEEKECDIEVYNLSAKGEKQIYKITKRTVFVNTSLDEIKLNIKKSDGTGLFFIKTSQNGSVVEISKAEDFYGFEGERQCALSFADSVAMSTAGGNTLYFKDVPITAVYEYDGEYKITQVDWSMLQGRYCGSSAYMRFYGRDKCFVPEVALLYGELSSIGSKARKYGVVTAKDITLNEDGKEAVMLSVLVGMAKMKYVVSEETAAKIPQRAFIAFYDELLFSEYDLTLVSEPIDLTGRMSSWEESFFSGTVEKINSDLIYLTDGRAACLHPNQNFFVEYNKNNPVAPFKGIMVSDIHEGDKVYCNYLSDGIRGIIVEAD